MVREEVRYRDAPHSKRRVGANTRHKNLICLPARTMTSSVLIFVSLSPAKKCQNNRKYCEQNKAKKMMMVEVLVSANMRIINIRLKMGKYAALRIPHMCRKP